MNETRLAWRDLTSALVTLIAVAPGGDRVDAITDLLGALSRVLANRQDWNETRLAWRDNLLDTVARVLAKNQDTAALAGRLNGYLVNARAIEEQETGGWDGARSRGRVVDWTAERLQEIERGKIESALRPLAIEWLRLTGVFRLVREERAPRRPLKRARDWRPFVEAEERRLVARFTGRTLTHAQRDEVIATEKGKIRTPRPMALRLLYLVCRSAEEDFQTFRRQLLRVNAKLAPPAL